MVTAAAATAAVFRKVLREVCVGGMTDSFSGYGV